MTTAKKLAAAALVGLFSAGTLVAGPAFAGEGKAACKGANGCKGKPQAEKAECKTDEGKEKSACKGANGCKGKEQSEKAACNTAEGEKKEEGHTAH